MTRVFAAGSLRLAFNEAAAAFSKAGGGEIEFSFGSSGLLRDRLKRGEKADVFASANMEHPKALADRGKAAPVRMFARNRVCVLAAPGVRATTGNVLDRMLDPDVKLGTSTPKADPGGDYAWEVFERAERVRPGAYAALSKKALQLIGGPTSPPTPRPGRSTYAALLVSGKADLFLVYCTIALAATREEPSLTAVALPEPLRVDASYGLTTLKGASPGGKAFAEFLLSAQGQDVLESHGFLPPAP